MGHEAKSTERARKRGSWRWLGLALVLGALAFLLWPVARERPVELAEHEASDQATTRGHGHWREDGAESDSRAHSESEARAEASGMTRVVSAGRAGGSVEGEVRSVEKRLD